MAEELGIKGLAEETRVADTSPPAEQEETIAAEEEELENSASRSVQNLELQPDSPDRLDSPRNAEPAPVDIDALIGSDEETPSLEDFVNQIRETQTAEPALNSSKENIGLLADLALKDR